jgi:hypothetical protein
MDTDYGADAIPEIFTAHTYLNIPSLINTAFPGSAAYGRALVRAVAGTDQLIHLHLGRGGRAARELRRQLRGVDQQEEPRSARRLQRGGE